jgi:hypothetical protein
VTGPELDSAMASIGWTGRALAGRLDCSEMLVRKWRTGALAVPDPVARWLARVVRTLDNLPPPGGWKRG